MSSDPDVDVIIPVHDPRRPISRAVASVLDHNASDLRLTVVCHNTPEEGIRSQLTAHHPDPRLRFLALDDGIPSPTGPFNFGLDRATARFTSVMGSDDELEPGAVDSWLAVADRDDAAVVIPRLRHVAGRGVPTPPVRPGRRSNLDGVRDRLAYRSAPLGLVSTREFGSERFPPNLRAGEDVVYVLAVWFSGARISFDRRGPAYLIHGDASDRVTMGAKPVSADTAFLKQLITDPRFTRLDPAQTLAVVLKLLRVHVFAMVANRPDAGAWTDDDRQELAAITARLLALVPRAGGILSRADNALLEAIVDPGVSVPRLLELAERRRRFLHPSALLSGDVRQTLAREAPLRMLAASALVRGVR